MSECQRQPRSEPDDLQRHLIQRQGSVAARRRRPWLEWTALAYLMALAAVWLIIRWGGDRWWLATVMMFGPKWVYAVPLPLLVLGALAWRGGLRLWAYLALSGLVLAFAIGRFCVPWPPWPSAASAHVTVLSCNTGREKCDAQRLTALIGELKPDVVCLQECREGLERVFADTWEVQRAGGLVVATPTPAVRAVVVKREVAGRWPRPIALVVRLTLPSGAIHVANVHCLSPRHGLADVTSARTVIAPSKTDELVEQTFARRQEHGQLRERLRRFPGPLLVVGDFNAPATSTIYREAWSEFNNAFTETGWGLGHTVKIKQGSFSFTARIDHILATPGCRFVDAWVGPDVGSDHRPLVAKITLP